MMKMFPFLVVLVVMVAALGFVPAARADEEKTLPAAEIASVLADLGLKVEEDKDDEEKTFWTIKVSDDQDVLLYQYGGEGNVASSLAISTVYSAKVDLQFANLWNAAERYTKAYMVEEDMVVLETDMDMSVSPSKAVVKKFVQDFTKVHMPKFEEAIKE